MLIDDVDEKDIGQMLDDLTSEPRTLHVVYQGMDNLRIVKPEGEIAVAYEIQERDGSKWETKVKLTGKQALAIHGMFNKRRGRV